ncbi:DUF3558 domain-containing protein [Nocardia sp. NPDC050710]|uniref:DUF3558 domain-containing protein n=1 Tax=Nocardia sp. NPDC050710 TaxID=3157220 RepID=UPI0033CE3EDB
MTSAAGPALSGTVAPHQDQPRFGLIKSGNLESSQVERVGMAHRLKLMLVAAAIVPGLVACGGSTSGNPTASTSSAPVTLFDPCTGIPDDALIAAGIKPSTEESGIAGVHQSGWEICAWDGPKYGITVFSTGRTMSEFENKPGNVQFQDVTIASRKGRQFRIEGASHDLMCDVAFPAAQGAVTIKLSNHASLDNPEEPCGLLRRVGESIVPTLPN